MKKSLYEICDILDNVSDAEIEVMFKAYTDYCTDLNETVARNGYKTLMEYLEKLGLTFDEWEWWRWEND